MLGREVLGILMSGAIVGSALAQSDGGDYELLSAGNQRSVDALHSAQQPILESSGQTAVGTPLMTHDDIASMRSDGGWGATFKDLKDRGYYPDAKNLGQVISRANHRNASPETTATVDGGGQLHIGSGAGRGHGAVDRATKTTDRSATRSTRHHARRTTTHAVRHQRIHRVQRVHRSGSGGGHGKK